MIEHEGKLVMLGNSVSRALGNFYSVIEFDNKIFTSVLISKKLDNYLSRGLESGKPTKIWVMKMGFGNKTIPCIELDGKKYASRPFSLFGQIFLSIIWLVLSLIVYNTSVAQNNMLYFVPISLFFIYLGVGPIFSYLAISLKADVKL